MSRSINTTATDRSQVLILLGTVGLVLFAGIWMRLAETRQVRPAGVLQLSLLAFAVLVAASVGAVIGRRLFSRPTAALLGAVGGGLAASFVHPILGAMLGFVVGLLVSLALARTALRVGLAFVCGFLAVCLARRVYLDAAWPWLWISILVVLAGLGVQLVCVLPIAQRLATREGRPRRWLGLTAFGLCALMTLVLSWVGGWHGEFYRRIHGIEERGGSVYLDWRGSSPSDWLQGPRSAWVSLKNPQAGDWAIVETLAMLPQLSISGVETDDASLTEMPPLPAVWDLFVNGANVNGSFLADRKLPNLSQITVHRAPFDDEAMIHIGELQGLTTLALAETNVTGLGLSRLGGLRSLATLHLTGERIRDDDLRGLAGMGLTSLHLNCANLTTDGLKHLRDLVLLVDLRISSPVDDLAVRSLAGLPCLRTLTVHMAEVTPETTAALRQIPANVTLHVYVPHEEVSGHRSLKRQLPKAQISTY